jgi:hypothetical protein
MQAILVSPQATSATSSALEITEGTVVLNDNTASSQAGLATALNSYAYLETLAIKCKLWEENAFRTSNEQSYLLLGECYHIYKSMEGTSTEALGRRIGLRDYINLKGLDGTLKNSHTMAKIVMCVFGTKDRKRVSSYSIVLRSALAKKVAPEDIPAFIRAEGGIEHIRRAKSPNAMTTTEKATCADTAVKSNSMGVFASTELAGKLDAGNIGEHVVLIGTWQADGSVIVRACVSKAGVVNAALAAYYTDNKSAMTTVVAEAAAANDANAKQEAIAQAVSQAVVNG